MPQTKTRPKAKSKPKAKSRSGSKPRKAAAKPRKAKAKAKPQRKETPKAAKTKAASNGKAGAGKATLPLIAGGAALAGVAGGVALGAAKSGSRVLGIKLPQPKRVQLRSKDLSKAAKEVGDFSDRIGGLTSELRSFREGLGDGKQNSPLEILLKGLTERR